VRRAVALEGAARCSHTSHPAGRPESAAIAARRPDERTARAKKAVAGRAGPASANAGTPADEAGPAAAPQPASLKRRIAALVYDALLVLGIWMLLTFAYVMASNERMPPAHAFALLLGSAVVFCSYFWVAHGRTLGMQAWHLRLQSKDGGRVTLTQALARFTVLFPGVLLLQAGDFLRPAVIFALLYFQAAYLWALFNPARATWADLMSQTRMVRIPPPQR
jgi:uncharacterized RDD family membrane protein YckC